LICKEVYNNDVSFEVNYDKLVIGIGAENATFGIPGVREHAYFLKELSDARTIRQKIIACFEEASIPSISVQERKRLLNFVIVGGGPTGVETAAELMDFFWEDLSSYYPDLPVHEVRITLLEAGHTILSAFNRKLVSQAMKTMRKQGIDLRTDNQVAEVRKDAVVLKDGNVLPCGLVVWSTGIAPRPLIRKLSLPKTPQGRIVVGDHLEVEGMSDVFAIGDCTEIKGTPLPATAQVASQQGKYLADAFNAEAAGKEVAPFKFRFLGLMTYIGHYQSLLDTDALSGTGFIEWLAWRSVYLTRLGSWKNKFQVPFNWLRTILWGRDVTNF
jgi:NADH:ubiquinone reductase (non-electrogenic)